MNNKKKHHYYKWKKRKWIHYSLHNRIWISFRSKQDGKKKKKKEEEKMNEKKKKSLFFSIVIFIVLFNHIIYIHTKTHEPERHYVRFCFFSFPGQIVFECTLHCIVGLNCQTKKIDSKFNYRIE